MQERNETLKQQFLIHLRESMDKAQRIASEFSKAVSEGRVQAEGYWAIRDSLAEFIRVADRLPDEAYENPSFYTRALASDNAMRLVAESMDPVLESAGDVSHLFEMSATVVVSGASITASAIGAFTAAATEHSIPISPMTVSRLENYATGLGSPAREKVRELLAEVDARFVHQYDEVWRTLSQSTPEGTLSASANMRQLFLWVLQRLAPDEEVMRQPWYEEPDDTNRKVTRSQRVRYLFRDHPKNEEYVNALLTLIPENVQSLQEGVHRDPTAEWDRGEVARAVQTLDVALYRILAERTK